MKPFNGMIVYVAGPYRSEDSWEVHANIRRAKEMGDELIQEGIMPLIPHKNTELCEHLNTSQFFLDGTLELMRRCDALLIVPKYENSEGTLGEIAEARKLGKPVFFDILALTYWAQKRQEAKEYVEAHQHFNQL
jgi:nucleoside 2-deoxyribosyltransferase